MNKKFIKFILFFAVVFSLIASTTVFSAVISEGGTTVTGQYLLKYKPSVEHSLTDGSVVTTSASKVSVTETESIELNGLVISPIEELEEISDDIDYTEINSEDLILDIPENAMRIEERDGETLFQIAPDYSLFEEPVSLFSLRREAEAGIGTSRTFQILNYSTEERELADFTCFYISDHCEVFVQNSLNYGDSDEATKKNIATLIGEQFGNTVKPYVTSHLANYTGYYGDENGKIVILIEDVKDDFGVGGYSGYTAGYFLKDTKTLHIDTYPLMRPEPKDSVSTPPTDESIENAFPTVAHEFTHMVETAVTENASFECIWFAELFAISSEASLFPDETAENEYKSYKNGSYYIKHGAVVNFKDYSVNGDVIGANYGLLYMFQNYLRGLTLEEDGETKVFYNILKHTETEETFEGATVAGVNETLKTMGKDFSFSDFDDLVKSFYIAFMLQENNQGKCENKYHYYSSFKHIQNLMIPLSTTLSMNNRSPGAAIVYPLLNRTAEAKNDGFEYVAFSYSDTPEISSAQYPDSTYSFLMIDNSYISLSFPEPYFAVNGYMNCFFEDNKPYLNQNCYNLLKGVCFVTNFDGLLPLRDGSYEIIGLTDKYFTLSCHSLNDIKISDTVTMKFDPESKFQISSFASFPKITDNTMDFKIRYLSKEALGTMKLYSAIYDRDTNMLLGANSGVFGADKLTLYVNKNMPPVTFSETESGKYILKIFAFDGEDALTPLSLPYELNFQSKVK